MGSISNHPPHQVDVGLPFFDYFRGTIVSECFLELNLKREKHSLTFVPLKSTTKFILTKFILTR